MTDLVERTLHALSLSSPASTYARLCRELATALEAKDTALRETIEHLNWGIECIRLEKADNDQQYTDMQARAETAERERDAAREALKQIIARTYSSDRRCRLDYEPVAEIHDIAARVITGEKP